MGGRPLEFCKLSIAVSRCIMTHINRPRTDSNACHHIISLNGSMFYVTATLS